MAVTFTGALAQINTLEDGGKNTAATLRGILFYLAVLADGSAGGSSNYTSVSINSGQVGDTYEIEGAAVSRQVTRNGATLYNNVDYTFTDGVWTFITQTLLEGDNLTFIWE